MHRVGVVLDPELVEGPRQAKGMIWTALKEHLVLA